MIAAKSNSVPDIILNLSGHVFRVFGRIVICEVLALPFSETICGLRTGQGSVGICERAWFMN